MNLQQIAAVFALGILAPEALSTTCSGGTFSLGSLAQFSVGLDPIALDAGDLDGDGWPDLVVASDISGSVSVFSNQGGAAVGQNRPGPSFGLPVGGIPFGVVIADLNHDGKPDLLVSVPNSAKVLYFRNIHSQGALSKDSFARPVSIDLPGLSGQLAVRDIDGDGVADLVVGSTDASKSVQVLRQRGNSAGGTPPVFDQPVSLSTGQRSGDFLLVDLDGDGKLDVVVPDFYGYSIGVCQNFSVPGSLAAADFGDRITLGSGMAPQAVAVADIDGDGKPDIGAIRSQPGSVALYRNVHTGGPLTAASFSSRVTIGSTSDQYAIRFVDLDRDGRPDMLTTVPGGVRYYRNSGATSGLTASSFEAPVSFPSDYRGVAFLVTDLDRDGVPDVATVDPITSMLNLLPGIFCDGEPTFTTQPADVYAGEGASASLSVEVSTNIPSKVQWYRNSGAAIPRSAGPILSFVDLGPADADAYYAVASYACGAVTSHVAHVVLENPRPGLVAWWRANGETLEELSRRQAQSADVSYSATPQGQAFEFHGGASGIFVGDMAELALSTEFTFTFRMLVRPAGDGRRAAVLFRGDPRINHNSYAVWIDAPSTLVFETRDAATSTATLTAPLPPETWVHVTCVFDHGKARVYQDGSLVAEQAGMAIPFVTLAPGGGFELGNAIAPQTAPFVGALTDVVVYSRALSAAEAASAAQTFGPLGSRSGRPGILHAPDEVVAGVGEPALLRILATGTEPLSYSWFHGDLFLAGGPSPLLSIASVQRSDRGPYSVVVSNSFGTIRSSPIMLLTGPEPPSSRLVPIERQFEMTLDAAVMPIGGQTNLQLRYSGISGYSTQLVLRVDPLGSVSASSPRISEASGTVVSGFTAGGALGMSFAAATSSRDLLPGKSDGSWGSTRITDSYLFALGEATAFELTGVIATNGVQYDEQLPQPMTGSLTLEVSNTNSAARIYLASDQSPELFRLAASEGDGAVRFSGYLTPGVYRMSCSVQSDSMAISRAQASGSSTLEALLKVTDGPLLRATRSASVTHLAWSTNAVGFVLQSSAQLDGAATWIDVPGNPALEAGEFVLEVDPLSPSRYFRLHRRF